MSSTDAAHVALSAADKAKRYLLKKLNEGEKPSVTNACRRAGVPGRTVKDKDWMAIKTWFYNTTHRQ
jgi:hypothetical protein